MNQGLRALTDKDADAPARAMLCPTVLSLRVADCRRFGEEKITGAGSVQMLLPTVDRGFKSAIMADAAFEGGNYEEPPLKGLKAAGRHWAGWGFSQEWYRREL